MADKPDYPDELRRKRKYNRYLDPSNIESVGIEADKLFKLYNAYGEMAKKDNEMLKSLFDYYGLTDNENKWESLARALARNHISGFMYSKPRGRPIEWTAFLKTNLIIGVKSLINSGLSVQDACERMEETGIFPANETLHKKTNNSSLEKRYHEFKDNQEDNIKTVLSQWKKTYKT